LIASSGGAVASLPVQTPTKFYLLIDISKTANALGLNVPSTLLATAGKVIE
jgi:putative ABC transport system substrate-binding protein